mmetsp:Transcript_8900/g.22662  ORF Transcript_8900/g.22662 Transcript_8900/m.22662 type:complete len:135 (-) Transcript_8900:289-693(-)
MVVPAWKTVSYMAVPDQAAHLPDVHISAMRETAPRFNCNYYDSSGPGTKYNMPETRTAFPVVVRRSTFARSDRFDYSDVFSATRGMAFRDTPGPLRYPAPASAFDKQVRSTTRLKPVYSPPRKIWVTQEMPTRR